MHRLIKLAVVFSVLGLVGSGLSQTLTIQCPDSLVDLGRKWADAYSRDHASVQLQVKGGGVNAAFAALQTHKADAVFVPRAMRFKEAEACAAAFGQRPAELKIGVNGLAVFVN